MADIKRASYFTSEFLQEKDFNDEQAYHLNSGRRHNRVLHTSGVVDGLDVTLVTGKQIQVSAGSAIDRDGRAIVLLDNQTYNLTTSAAGDVYLTVAYNDSIITPELADPADRDTQGLNKFKRTTERPQLQDGVAVPPADGSVIVLARLHLAGAPSSITSIDTTVRTIGSAKVTPNAINTPQLADGAVGLLQLADEVKPLSVVGTNTITVVTDNTAKQITVANTHSGRTDDPHVTTVAQIDAQGGANRLVTQINAGTGVVTRTHVVSAVVSGVVTFENIPLSPNEVSSDNIDPAFGPGAVNVEFALDDIAQSGVTSSGDLGYGRTIMLRSEDDRTTGRFRILASRQTSGAGPVKVRWFAFKPAAGSDANVAISVSVAPPVATVLKNATQNFTATVKNTNNQNVTWSLDAADGTKGTLSNVTSNSVTYTPPLVSATYNLTAKSALDPNKQAVVPIDVRADVFVTVTPGFPTVFGGSPVNLTAAAFNTSTTGVTWSIREGASGGTLTVSGNNATYTAPTAPGTYHVDAVSTADTTKQGTATISVPAVTVALNQTNVTLPGRSTLSLNATVGNAVNKGVTWSVREFGAVGFLTSTTSTSTTYNAENTPGTFHVDAVPIADPTQKATCAITILPVTFSIRADQNPLETFSSTTITATVTGASDLRANWSGSASGSVSPGPSSTTTFFAPGVGSIYTVTGTSVADPNKSETISMDVQAPGDGPGGPAGGTDGGGIILPGSPSQFLPVKEGDFLATHPASTADSAPSTDEGADTGATARSFVRPKKRSGPKRRPKPNG